MTQSAPLPHQEATATSPNEWKNEKDSLVLEIAWEVVNQVGGIYTVLRSKAPTLSEALGDNYCLVGPYVERSAASEFEPIEDNTSPFATAVGLLRDQGVEAYYGRWLVTGRPQVVLINPSSAFHRLSEIKYYLYENHHISTPDDDLIDQVVSFGEVITLFLGHLARAQAAQRKIIAHFHEWMAGTPIAEIRRQHMPITMVFTTHATILGRYLAMNSPNFYEQLDFTDWEKEAKHFNIECQAKIERAAAHGAQVFTTVSEVTARECIYLLGRKPDLITPNGINIERFEALHTVQNLHQQYKDVIHEFVRAHFFPSYPINLDRVLYFFTSGRFEYKNKGFDITIEALARLNYRLKEAGSDMTVVMFFITKQPFHSIHPKVLQNFAMKEELRKTVEAIEKNVGDRLFNDAASLADSKLPDLNHYVDDYHRLRFRRTMQSLKTAELPLIVTHNMVNENDGIINFLRSSGLINHESDRVKVVYHPDFINATNPLFGIDYGEFVRGTHLGLFPSYYEPWGYTPLECAARGVPAVTSDFSGFGDYVLRNMPDHHDKGIFLSRRTGKTFDQAAEDLSNTLFNFCMQSRRDRIAQRNKVEEFSVGFDWKALATYYYDAYQLAEVRLP